MIYIIRGKEEYFIRQKLSEMIDRPDQDIVKIDGSQRSFSVKEVFESCQSSSLFASKTLVLVNDPPFLIKSADDKELEELQSYVNSPLFDVDLVFYTLSDSFNSRLNAYKLIAKNAQVFDMKQLEARNFPSYVRQILNEEKVEMDQKCINLLIALCKKNVSLFHRNLQIIKLYPGKIDEPAVRALCTQGEDNDNFELINAITSHNTSKAISLCRSMIDRDNSINGLIGLLASQLRFLYYVAYLNEQGNSKSEIMSLTGSQEYRISKALETLNRLSGRQIMFLLKELSDLDIRLKTDSTADEKSRFELYILNMMR